MGYQITHIRLTHSSAITTEAISEVKLSNGSEEIKAQVVNYIDNNFEYYYTNVKGYKAYVEAVHPSGKKAYIRTKADSTNKDNPLNLPRF